MGKEGETIRRRRECLKCEGRFTTYERVEEVLPSVIKKDGRREDFRLALHAQQVRGARTGERDGVEPQRLLAAFVSAGVALRRFEIVTPTLHQIFVDKVGEEAAVAARLPEGG